MHMAVVTRMTHDLDTRAYVRTAPFRRTNHQKIRRLPQGTPLAHHLYRTLQRIHAEHGFLFAGRLCRRRG